MLAKDREKRYQNAGELLKDLEAAAREKPWWQTRRAVVGMAATPVALAGAALGFNVRGWRTQLMNWMEPPAAAAIRLAVMPFVNMTGDPEQEYFSDGITQELIAQLGSLHPAGLNVIARTSVMRYKNTTKPLEEVARELKVEYLLEGSARREGGRARITTELIRVRDQIQLWAETFERELSGILVLQSEVARKVAGALALKLLPAEQARLAGVRQVNPEAYEAYLKGLQQWYKLTRQGLDAAMQQFELALRISPDYALAHAGVSLVWIGRQQMGVVPTLEAAPKLKAAAGEALALGEDLPEVRYVLALVKTWTDWDWAGGEQEFQRSIALNPSFPDARAYYSHLLVYLRRHDEALEQMARAMAMDPFNPLFQSLHARTLVILRRYDEAIGQARSALRVVQGLPVAVSALIDALNEKGMEAEAVEEWRADRTFRGDHRGIEAFDQGYREAGYRGAWRRFAEYRAVGFHKTGIGAIGIAAAFVRAGDTSQVLDWLEKAFEVRDPNLPYVFSDPKYATLRAEPRFQVLRRRMNLPD
jgi:TolB-like protein